ncbi:WYL domain-containing protein [Desulfopila sp. IMCC35008]|uniref:WYL domain-containing protein n=1 Tax=Desulfopila sp. IMCC35008 TaxID=2653858 RepID=UPI0013D253CC|nr:WYL domain-containing protein [Desulfopila sp. IMCC35008]
MHYKKYSNLKWEIRQRLASIEAALLWKGRVNRKDLKELFGIGEIQAAKDFSKYHELFPNNMVYDRIIKSHIPSDRFKPKVLKGTAEEFFRLLQSVPPSRPDATIVLLNTLPSVEIVCPGERSYENKTLQIINQAICDRLKVVAQYQSMSTEVEADLILSPHALVYNGFRWHIRAYSEKHEDYRDFLLARIRSILPTQDIADQDARSDSLWNEMVDIIILPHPGLSASQSRVIEGDYGMVDGAYKHTTRGALVGYFLQLMKVGIGDKEREARVQQIILGNREELSPYIF